MVAGFLLCVVGVYLTTGAGWTCLFAGAVLFVAGGMAKR